MELDLLKPFFELKKLDKPTECYNCKETIQVDDEFPAIADLYRKFIYKGRYILCSKNCLKIKTEEYIKKENEGAELANRIKDKMAPKAPEMPSVSTGITDNGLQLPLEETPKTSQESLSSKNFEPSANFCLVCEMEDCDCGERSLLEPKQSDAMEENIENVLSKSTTKQVSMEQIQVNSQIDKTQPIVLLDEIEKKTETEYNATHFTPKNKNAIACFVCNQIKDVPYFRDILRKTKHLPNSICKDCLPKRLEELEQGITRKDEIVDLALSRSDNKVDKETSAVDKFNQRVAKTREKVHGETETIKEVENYEPIANKDHPLINLFEKITVTETNKIKQLVHDGEANHRENYCSYCDSQNVAYEVRNKKTGDLKTRLCENCYENKWDVEWDSRCGGEFHKL